ncbi:MAG TPA: hypothetical protein VFF23_04350 [Hanamia sp.]|nr:hypothetical protein [Hanamia sp.]
MFKDALGTDFDITDLALELILARTGFFSSAFSVFIGVFFVFKTGFFSVDLIGADFLLAVAFFTIGLAAFFAALFPDTCFFSVLEFLSDFPLATLAAFAFLAGAFFATGFSFTLAAFTAPFLAAADLGPDFPVVDFDATTVAFFLVAIKFNSFF